MTTRAHISTIMAAGALTLALAACGSSDDDGATSKATTTTESGPQSTSAPASAGTEIVIEEYDFAPKTLRAEPGTVTVRNNDGTAHSVTADDGQFDTGRFASGTKTIDVTEPGTYAYYCAVHPFMTGTLVVSAG